jgi:[lysine-biosynthesis-protein LysW]--L-2-aminoadipate ligase
MKMAVLYSRVRVEEKAIFAALQRRAVPFDALHVDELRLDLNGRNAFGQYDVGLCRCLSHLQATYLTRWLEVQGVPVVSPHHTVVTCGDKLLTSTVLREAGIPVPRTRVALSSEAAIQAMEEIGYPVVLKPLLGSWGRLLARINDRDAAEAILEHKMTLGGYEHSVFYIQEYVNKPGRDIRSLVAGNEVVYAVYRYADHWITNTARGGQAQPCPLTPEVKRLSLAAARAVGGGIVAVDLLETADGALLVNEVNHTPEFHGAMEATHTDIAAHMVDYLIQVAAKGEERKHATHVNRRSIGVRWGGVAAPAVGPS